MHSFGSTSRKVSIIGKSCPWSWWPLASCNAARVDINSVKPTVTCIGSVAESRHPCCFYALRTFKTKAMKNEEGQRRFPPQHQDKQPGKEYLMNPLPQFTNYRYRPSAKLYGKVALVTGGDSGIGRAVSYAFAREGASIAFTYVKGDEDIDANDTLKIINKSKMRYSGYPIAIPTDLGYNINCKNVVDKVIEKYGRIDILVNNAAVQYPTYSLDDITEERLERVFRTNIYSYFFLTSHALKHMKKGSTIINTASLLAFTGSPKLLDYASTKGAVVSFTKGLAQRLLSKGIRVNVVAPGPVWTPLEAAALDDQDIATFGSEVPMNRAAQPFEIAPTYVFLASEDSSYYTGQVLHCNGGGLHLSACKLLSFFLKKVD